MTLSLPKGGGRPAASNATAQPAVTAASITLPLRFILTGVAALTVGIAWLVLQPSVLELYHYNQNVIAVTHLFVLGWIATVVMGAMYQLVPVALETRLYSERLAKWQFVFHAIGFAGMVWMLRDWNMKHVGHFGSALAFGVLLFIYNIARTLLKTPRWNVIAVSIASALSWIGFTVLAGLALATAKLPFDPDAESLSVWSSMLAPFAAAVRGFEPLSAMHAHAHLGVVGFFIMLIVGVSYKLIPMFTLSEIQNRRRAMASVVLLNIGIVGSFIAVLTSSPWKIFFALVIVAALAIYAVELRAILRARKRGPLDWGVRYFLTALLVLPLVAALGAGLAWPGLELTPFTGQLENVYGFLALIGVVSFAIIGMLYKIVPFLVWFGAYGSHIGKAKVPALGDMYSSRLQCAGYWLFLAGLAITAAATLFANPLGIRIGCGFIAGAVVTLLLNLGSILAHFARPRLEPIGLQPRNRP